MGQGALDPDLHDMQTAGTPAPVAAGAWCGAARLPRGDSDCSTPAATKAGRPPPSMPLPCPLAHMVPPSHQVVAEVAAHKARAARHQHAVLLHPWLGLDGRPLRLRVQADSRAAKLSLQAGWRWRGWAAVPGAGVVSQWRHQRGLDRAAHFTPADGAIAGARRRKRKGMQADNRTPAVAN